MVRLSLRPRTVTAALIGAVAGVLLVWILEVTGHRWWSVLLMIAAAVGPGAIKSIYKSREQRPISILRWTRYRVPMWVRVGSTLPLVIATLVILSFFDLNPRDPRGRDGDLRVRRGADCISRQDFALRSWFVSTTESTLRGTFLPHAAGSKRVGFV
jgi:hypothetical protein